jgi:hypothetical protein
MFLVDDEECVNVKYLVPPNQQDWQFRLSKDKTEHDVWYVLGTREFEEIHMLYVQHNGVWVKQN